MAENLFCEATMTFDYLNLISSSLSEWSENPISKKFPQSILLRYHVHNNGMYRKTTQKQNSSGHGYHGHTEKNENA